MHIEECIISGIITKISPVWDWWSTPTYCQLQSHVTQKLGQKSKIQPRQALVFCPNLQICGQLPAPVRNGEKTAFKNGQISDIQGLMTLTLDRVILHTVMHHSSSSTYTSNFIEIEETSCGRTDGRTQRRTGVGHLRPTLLGRLAGVDLKMATSN